MRGTGSYKSRMMIIMTEVALTGAVIVMQPTLTMFTCTASGGMLILFILATARLALLVPQESVKCEVGFVCDRQCDSPEGLEKRILRPAILLMKHVELNSSLSIFQGIPEANYTFG